MTRYHDPHPSWTHDYIPTDGDDLHELQARFDAEFEQPLFHDQPDPWWINWIIPVSILFAIGVWVACAKLLVDFISARM